MILFVDDDIRPTNLYIRELTLRGYDVVQMLDATTGYDYVVRHASTINLIIADIMMPPGSRYEDSDVDAGISSGIALCFDIKRRYSSIDILVLTNIADRGLLAPLADLRRIRVYRKQDLMPYELPSVVEEILAGGEREH